MLGTTYALVVSKSPRRASDEQYLRFWVKKGLTSKSFTWNGSFEERVRDPVTGQVSVVSNSSPSLLSHRTYYWHVVAIRNGVVTKSRESTFTVVRPMAIPTGLNVPSTKEIGRSFNIAWNSVSGASRYELRRRKDTSSSWQTIYNGSRREYTETHLDSGRYYYSVRACNGNCSGWSQQDHINITFQPPSLLSPSQNANADTVPCFEWEETGVGTTYGIAVSTSRRANDGRYNRFWVKKPISGTRYCWDSSFTEKERNPSTGIVETISNTSPNRLDTGRTYYWHVIAFNGSSAAKSNESVFSVDLPAPTILSPLNSSVTQNEPCFEWTDVGATSYRVSVSTSNRRPDGKFDRFWVKEVTNSTQYCWDNSFTEKERNPSTGIVETISNTSPNRLDADRTYYWHVIAFNGSSAAKSLEANFNIEAESDENALVEYEYDDSGRLVIVKVNGVIVVDYRLDAADNRTQVDYTEVN